MNYEFIAAYAAIYKKRGEFVEALFFIVLFGGLGTDLCYIAKGKYRNFLREARILEERGIPIPQREYDRQGSEHDFERGVGLFLGLVAALLAVGCLGTYVHL